MGKKSFMKKYCSFSYWLKAKIKGTSRILLFVRKIEKIFDTKAEKFLLIKLTGIFLTQEAEIFIILW